MASGYCSHSKANSIAMSITWQCNCLAQPSIVTMEGEWRVITMETRRPYRILICANRFRSVKRLKRMTTIERTIVAWISWTPTQAYQEARLPSAGSFLYPGIFAVRRAAMDAFKDSSVCQVQVRTNQDRKVYLWNRHSDGRISGYRPD